MRRAACLAAFLTRLPTRCHSLEDAAEAYNLVPLIGLLEGLIVALAGLAARDHLAAAAAMLLAHLLVTGGLHLDGFADYSDVIGSGARGEQAVRVMRDARRGGMALAYTASIVAARALLYAALHARPAAIAACYTAAAEAMYLASMASPPRHPGLGRLFHERGVAPVAKRASNLAVYAVLAAALAAIDPITLAVHAAAVLTSLAVARDAGSRGIGATGDVLGFTYEASLTAALLAAAYTQPHA